MSHHVYFYKKLRLIYDQFENQSFNNYNYNVILDNLNDLNEYIGEEYYEIIIKMYVDIFELEKEKIKRKYIIKDIMITSKYLCVVVINILIFFCKPI